MTLIWDGTNNSGTAVTPGTYEIEVHWDDGQGQTSNISRNVLVVGVGVSGVAVARPNVLSPQQTLITTFDATGIVNVAALSVNIYTLAGERVATVTGTPGSAFATFMVQLTTGMRRPAFQTTSFVRILPGLRRDSGT